MYILICPHPDDELIGAFSLIKKGLIDKVVYIDPPPARYERAIRVGKESGFIVEKSEFKDFYAYLESNPSHTFLVPDSADNHLLHQAINLVARQSICCLGYYSTDMNTGYTRELRKEDKKQKLAALNKFYPDQKSLWVNDWKYWLFEGVVFEPSLK